MIGVVAVDEEGGWELAERAGEDFCEEMGAERWVEASEIDGGMKKFQLILNESNNPNLLANLHKTGILYYLETPPRFFRQDFVSEFLRHAKLTADGKIVSSVIQGQPIQITESKIAEFFQLPRRGSTVQALKESGESYWQEWKASTCNRQFSFTVAKTDLKPKHQVIKASDWKKIRKFESKVGLVLRMSKLLEDMLNLPNDDALSVLISDWIPKKESAHLQSLKKKRRSKAKLSNTTSSNSTDNTVPSPNSKNGSSVDFKKYLPSFQLIEENIRTFYSGEYAIKSAQKEVTNLLLTHFTFIAKHDQKFFKQLHRSSATFDRNCESQTEKKNSLNQDIQPAVNDPARATFSVPAIQRSTTQLNQMSTSVDTPLFKTKLLKIERDLKPCKDDNNTYLPSEKLGTSSVSHRPAEVASSYQISFIKRVIGPCFPHLKSTESDLLIRANIPAIGNHKLPIFSVENYDNWSRRMKAHLCSIHENMWEIIKEGPIIIMMDNDAHIVDINQPARIPKSTNLLTNEDRMKDTKNCATAKEIWDLLADLCRESEAIKGNKLQLAVDKYESFKMQTEESISSLETRFLGIISEMNNLGRSYPNSEMNSKILDNLTDEWDMKVIATKEEASTSSAQDAAFYGERTRFRDARGRNNFRRRSSLTKENQGGSSTERKREATEKKENLTDDINDQIQSITKLLEKLKRARDKQSVSPQTDEVPKVEKTYQLAERPAEPFRSGNRNLGEYFHCHKQGHYRFECPELPEDKKVKVRRRFFKRKTMVANLENAVLDDLDYPFGIDSDGYSSEDEALFCLMADNDEEVSTADSQTSFYHINEATVSSNELDMKLMMLEDQLASISCLHVELKDENDKLRSKVTKLSIDHERINYLESQFKEFEKLKLRTADLEKENQKLRYHSTDSRRVERESKLMKRSKSVDSLNDKKPKVWQVWIPKDLMYKKGPDMKRDKSILCIKKTKEIWYLDSGCSKHMTGDREDLDGCEGIKGPLVTFGDNSKSRTIGEGFVVKGKVVVNGVSHVDGLKHKLLSISQLCDNGYSVDFTKNSCNIRDKSTGVILLTGIRRGNMYIVDWSTGYSEACFLSKGSTEASWLWHRRLNHLNFKTINYLAKKELVEGLPKEIYKKTSVCGPCQKGKQVKSSFKNKNHPPGTIDCLQLLHMDLFGPVRPQTPKGKRFTLVVVDNYSKIYMGGILEEQR
ncbi:hypothetical protein C2S52_009249 [Perilla frutescens var. hirtella]|nr:hypothetical protein C2S52_009249 [Perilla frutescens var. hirtella]